MSALEHRLCVAEARAQKRSQNIVQLKAVVANQVADMQELHARIAHLEDEVTTLQEYDVRRLHARITRLEDVLTTVSVSISCLEAAPPRSD